MRQRINAEKEWAFADIERICNVLDISYKDFNDFALSDTMGAQLTSEERKQIMLIKLNRGDLSLAANRDPYKSLEAQGGDGR
ncbi:hypothetical protein JS541_13805 [Bifidobacterium sp. SO1]|nr:hypothetical protein [Bifidobacterium sp. SO1]